MRIFAWFLQDSALIAIGFASYLLAEQLLPPESADYAGYALLVILPAKWLQHRTHAKDIVKRAPHHVRQIGSVVSWSVVTLLAVAIWVF